MIVSEETRTGEGDLGGEGTDIVGRLGVVVAGASSLSRHGFVSSGEDGAVDRESDLGEVRGDFVGLLVGGGGGNGGVGDGEGEAVVVATSISVMVISTVTAPRVLWRNRGRSVTRATPVVTIKRTHHNH